MHWNRSRIIDVGGDIHDFRNNNDKNWNYKKERFTQRGHFTYRNGNKRIVYKARNRIVYIDDFENLSMDFDSYTDDLYLDDSSDTEYDILQVYKPTTTEVFKTEREENKKKWQ